MTDNIGVPVELTQVHRERRLMAVRGSGAHSGRGGMTMGQDRGVVGLLVGRSLAA